MATDGDSTGSTTRRGVLAALLGALVYGLGWLSSAVTAQTASGQISNASEPAENVYVERVHLSPRTSDPSSPADGTMWYNEDA